MKRLPLIAVVLGLSLATSAAANTPTYDLDCSDGDSEVTVISQQQPYYPHSASMLCLSGWVKIGFTIDKQGIPRDVHVVESEPKAIFDASAVDAIESWRFIPACRGGEPTEQSVIQTIEFRLPASEEDQCPDGIDAIDGEIADLIGEVGARYALLAAHIRNGDAQPQMAATLGAPFDQFEGDLGRVAAFHRQALQNILSWERGRDLTGLFTDAFMAIMPHSLAVDSSLEAARDRLDRYRNELEDRATAVRTSLSALSEEYRELKHDTQLETQTLELLVKPFVGDIEAPIDTDLESRLRPAEDLQSLIDFLESRRGQWHIAEKDIHFDHEGDEEIWLERLDALIEHRSSQHEEEVQMLRMFKDYSN